MRKEELWDKERNDFIRSEKPGESTAQEEHKESRMLTYVLIGLVVGLLIFSTAQTFQISGLEKSVISGVAGGASISPASSAAVAQTGARVPAMVGGC